MLSERLRYLRTLHGFTQRQVADVLNIERSTYTYYETGKTHPDIQALIKLAKLYRITTDYLIMGDNATMQSAEGQYQSFMLPRMEDVSFLSLSTNEKSLIMFFRQLDKETQDKFLEQLKDAEMSETDS